MATLVKGHRSKAARVVGIALFIILMLVNMQVINSPFGTSNTKADTISNIWTVTCDYDGQGHLISKHCVSGGDAYCVCD